jgi:hypothetical protein
MFFIVKNLKNVAPGRNFLRSVKIMSPSLPWPHGRILFEVKQKWSFLFPEFSLILTHCNKQLPSKYAMHVSGHHPWFFFLE